MSSLETHSEATLQSALDALGLQGAVLETAATLATDTRVWRVRHRDRSLAIRLFRPQQRPVMENEVAALSLAAKHGIPVPEIISTGVTDENRPVMALTWVPGRPLAEVALEKPRLARRLGLKSGRVLAGIHQIPIEHHAGRSLMHVEQSTDRELRTCIESVATASPGLLHLDYHPFNLMAIGGRLTGVLDWTNTRLGDPRADIARTIIIMSLIAPAIFGRRGARRMALGRFTRGFLQGYTEDAGPLRDMAPFHAWAGEMLLADVAPKLDRLPVNDPARVYQRILEWTESWKHKALKAPWDHPPLR